MRFKDFIIASIIMLTVVLLAEDNAFADRRTYTLTGLKKKDITSETKKTDNNLPGKPFDELIKNRVIIEGLFTFYLDTIDNSLLMALKPEQFGPVYLCGETMSQSEGRFSDNRSMRRTFPFYFKRVGKDIMFLEKNLRLRADSTLPVTGAIASGLSDHLFAATEIKSRPQNKTGAILVDPADFFLQDASNISYFTGNLSKTGHSFDKKNSYFELVKSFPENSEIDVKLHYKTSIPQSGTTLQSGYDFFNTYHFSLSTLPQTDYIPRLADDRIGFFVTMFEDYTAMDRESPYVHYIDRWHLKKKYPDSVLSEPVEPIVFWIENTVPEEYRQAFAEGIEFWQPAFEKAGFKNAIIARQMPDSAEWDPADVRYSTVQWMINPGQAYAVGPHRSNPFTGQILDADIRISADWIRYMYNIAENYIEPITYDGRRSEDNLYNWYSLDNTLYQMPFNDNYQQEAALDAALNIAYLTVTAGDLIDKDSLIKVYVHDYLVEVIAHEVGHTLGLRHNFKASTIYTLDQVNDPEFTRLNSTTGSIMDYMSANIAGPDKKQGDFYARIPGPWDFWTIEYGYRDFGARSPEEEKPHLEKIASQGTKPELVFATDEDTFGWSAKKTDPLSNTHDLGDDPLAFALRKITQTRELWNNAIRKFEQPGQRYKKIRDVFQAGWRSYSELAQIAPQYIGGISVYRHHIGDENAREPFELVPAAEQRRAMQLLKENIFSPDAFAIPQELHNKLQPERLPDFAWSNNSIFQLDYPIHQMVLNIQTTALNKLYDPYTLGRLLNNLVRLNKDDKRYTMYDLFRDTRQALWSEMMELAEVNSFRRQLQLAHLNILTNIFLSSPGRYPADALTLAANDLEILYEGTLKAAKASSLDPMSRAHFSEVKRQIESARNAQKSFLK
ncbi:MAG: zinc-dependent metalloprotease [candidate division Zixibacteria bacterium]|nr:zinc-dependent metalloprotease [candidate division Zixibacteria bacterium]